MIHQRILPAANLYMKDLSETAVNKKAVSKTMPTGFEETMLRRLSSLTATLLTETDSLKALLSSLPEGNSLPTARYLRDHVIPTLNRARTAADEIESLLGRQYAPFPSYAEMLFKI